MATGQIPAFGELLRRYRKAAGLTQEELAEEASLSVRAISDLERGLKYRPRKDTVQLLGEALQLAPPDRAVFEEAARKATTPSAAGPPVLRVAPPSKLLCPGSWIAPIRWRAGLAGLVLALIALLIGVFVLRSRSAAESARPTLSSRATFVPWGSTTAVSPDRFRRPSAVAVDPRGNVYVADTGNNRVEKVSPRGDLLAVWGAQRSGSPRLHGPSAIAVYPQGNIVVVDAGRHRIQELSPTGRHGAGLSSQAAYFVATTTDALGAGYTIDLGITALLKELPHTEHFVGPLQFDLGPVDAPAGVAVDGKGSIYLTAGNGHIWKLSPTGKPLAEWGGEGTKAGQFESPTGVAVDRQGHLFVVDSGNNRIQELSAATGRPLAEWGTRGSDPGQFRDPRGIAIDAHGTIYVADTGNNRIQQFSSSGRSLGVWTAFQPPPGRFVNAGGITVDGQGNVYVLTGFGDNELYKLSPTGRPLMRVGPSVFLAGLGTYLAYGSGPIEQNDLESVAVDAQGTIYVADFLNGLVLKLSATGHVLARWGHTGVGPGEFTKPSGIAVDRHGYVYVADSGNARIQKFTSDGKWLTQWGSSGAGPGQFRWLAGVAFDDQSNVYVLEQSDPLYVAARIQKFSPDGEFISSWGGRGSGAGQFLEPGCIATDSHGNVYVADSGNNRILELSPMDKPIAHWGTMGTRPGQFSGPGCVAVDGQGDIYVADTGNSRIQKLSPVR